MRGRKPIPTRLKVLRGNPGQRPLPQNEPQPKAGRPSCPSWLDDEAKSHWRRVCRELEALGLLHKCDLAALAALCQAWAEFRWATETLRREGRVLKSGDYSQPHPAVSQQRSAWKAIKDFSALFGLDPSSRTRIAAPPKSVEVDEFEAFLDRA